MRMWLLALVLVVVVAAAGGWYLHTGESPDVQFRTVELKRGTLLTTVEATGTVEPEAVVDVGAQVDGMIQSFGDDSNGKPIDYQSPVAAGMILARIDDGVYKADFNTAQAQLDEGKSNRLKGQADVDQATAKLHQAEQNWVRAQQLGPSDALSKSDYENYQTEWQAAKANVAVAEAEIAQANASMNMAQASLDKARRNLDFCTIKSPVKGTIIDRRVNIGQTVVSNLSASSMFLIAKDLSHMQVWVAVNEADVNSIKPGQTVNFTCDALPGEAFIGTVGKVRYNAQSTQNVVVYTVEVNTDNSSGRLIPYLTASAQFQVRRDDHVLLAQNSALRWYPASADEVDPAARGEWKSVEDQDEASDPGTVPTTRPSRARPATRLGQVWVKSGAFVRPIDVKIGATDNFNTEITPVNNGSLDEGAQLVVAEMIDAGKADDSTDPFLPKMQHKK